MRNVVGRDAPGRALVPIILNGRSSAWSVLDVEITAAGVFRLSPGVSDQGAEAIRESPLELCLERPVARPARRQSVIKTGADPGHQAKLINLSGKGCAASRIGRGAGIYQRLTRRVGQARIRQTPADTSHVSDGQHVRPAQLALVLDVPLVRVRVLVVRI